MAQIKNQNEQTFEEIIEKAQENLKTLSSFDSTETIAEHIEFAETALVQLENEARKAGGGDTVEYVLIGTLRRMTQEVKKLSERTVHPKVMVNTIVEVENALIGIAWMRSQQS